MTLEQKCIFKQSDDMATPVMRWKFYFRLFTDDWIMTGGKHWLFSFMKEPFLFVESIKNSSDYHPLFRVEQNTSKNWGKTIM